jgi:hypothetical protein
VSSVYVDLAATLIDGDPLAVDDEAVRALQYLREGGLEIVVVSPDGIAHPEALREVVQGVVEDVPEHPEQPSWYLTRDMDRCRGGSARLRTVLLGGAPPSGSVRRCDGFARDLQAAAMEILAAEAMPGKL